ncbi:hypothetical protein KO481_31950 [Nocardia sp. NEAU-G5]|uniref:DUF4878 domain-containing protein n=1 Tax=Nocardia albiluteola TaxID=2842303 RepID=A0ABS6B727_9NOCA|nr:hypothetical protein [Nocardia albiluteola]MBU3066117.1 hypothetical protein [Nocardia albiluteola]
MSDPTDDQKPQPDSADSGRRPSSSAPGSGPASAPTSPDASATQRISRDELPGAAGTAGRTERIPREAGAAGPDTSAKASSGEPSAPRPGVGPSPLPPRPGPKPPAPPVPPRPGPTVPPAAPGSASTPPGTAAETQAIAKSAADQPAAQRPDLGAGDKTTVIPTSALPQTGGKSGAATESAPGGKTVIIPESALPGAGGKPVDDPKTVAMPRVSGASEAETTALPVQRPGEQATEKLQIGGQPVTDRVTPGGRAPITRPPATPRPGSGPKNTVPQGPSGPIQNPPVGEGVPGPRPGGAPSPADVQPTAPAPSMSSPTAPMSAPQHTPHDALLSAPQTPPHNAPQTTAPQNAPLGAPQNAPLGAPQPAAAPPPDAQQTHVIAAPQRIPGANPPMDAPAGSTPQLNKRWLLIAGAAVAAVVVIAVIIALVSGGTDNSPEAKVKAAIGDYTTALKSGNLPDLQSATCGAQHDFYKGIAPDQYASVHKLAVDQRKIPRVDAVDSVQITGDKAVAQASVYTDADPTRVARTFDLQNTSGGWKVCDSPNAG